MRIAMALLALSLSVSACKKKESKVSADNAGSGSAAVVVANGSGSDTMAGSGSGSAMGSDTMTGSGSGSDAAGSGSGDAAMQKKAGNCPSTVLGSTTTSKLDGKAVVVTVTSADKDAIASIQRRTEELLAEKKDNATAGGGHDGKGSHGGASGICPIYVPEGATAAVTKDAKGIVVTITPKDKADELQKEIEGRIAKTADWVKANVTSGDQGNQGGVGGGKGDHGGNHSGEGDGKGQQRKGGGGGNGGGGGGGNGGGGGHGDGTGGGHGTGGGGGN